MDERLVSYDEKMQKTMHNLAGSLGASVRGVQIRMCSTG